MEEKVCLVGLGYVGLPLAVAFAENGVEVKGFDISEKKIEQLNAGHDPCHEIESERLTAASIPFSTDPQLISEATAIIVAVPTPINADKQPDLRAVQAASRTVGEHLSKGAVVVFESTVYPGVTEEVCLPILEEASGLKGGEDFFVGYSPERVNPGDKEHTIEKIVKVVSGMDPATTDRVAALYEKPVKAGVFKAASIKTAEAAKVIENIQRDLNIALVNELALIFHHLGMNTQDVLDAASTKWNFHRYSPGLVGGHCIGVDPYYLVYKAQEAGYDPQVLLAGRRINEFMSQHVAQTLLSMMSEAGVQAQGARVAILGMAFKENVNDLRNSKAKAILKQLQEQGVEVLGVEPHVSSEELQEEFGISNTSLEDLADLDGVVLFASHEAFKALDLEELAGKFKGRPVLFDIKSFFDKAELKRLDYLFQSL